MTDTSELSKLLAERDKRKRERLLEFYRPYPKTREFHRLGASKRERALIAANRSGKTYAAGAEVAMHLTGQYPEWWDGKRFREPNDWWVSCETGILVRDGAQSILFGKANVKQDRGSGMVPRDSVLWDQVTSMHGYSGLYDTVPVKHISGGVSTCQMMTYRQSRETWQARALHGIWYDEEPPTELYSEGLTRIGTTAGVVLCTFTPLSGMTEVVMRYLNEPSADRAWVGMTLDEAEHISPEERRKIIEGYLPHEREARARGEPLLGEGKIFQTSESSIIIPRPPSLPAYWAYGGGIDFGWDHPFAAVQCAWDRDSDVFMVLDGFKMREARPVDHAQRMKPWGSMRFFWPHDGSQHDKGSGETLASQYKNHGVSMFHTHASHVDGTLSTEACIQQINEAESVGKFKVVESFEPYLAERRIYHRKDGQIVKLNDDLLSATMKAWMMKRYFKQIEAGQLRGTNREVRIAKDVDYNPFEIA